MKKRSVGQWLALAGNLVMCVGLLLNGLELLPLNGFRVFIGIGLAIDLIALILIFKRSEF